MKPAMPDVFSNRRYTVLSPYSDVRKQSAPPAVVAYSALRGTPPGDSFVNSFGARPSTARPQHARQTIFPHRVMPDSHQVAAGGNAAGRPVTGFGQVSCGEGKRGIRPAGVLRFRNEVVS